MSNSGTTNLRSYSVRTRQNLGVPRFPPGLAFGGKVLETLIREPRVIKSEAYLRLKG